MLKAGKRLKIVLTFLLCLGFSFLLQSSASASPQGGTLSAGQAVISQNGGTTTIQELTNSAIINWNSFNIGAGQLVQFLQPEALSAILNRVIGVDPSVIFGTLKSNGIIFLINPNGILFGQGSEIDT
ncbi:MAG: filamentous hemagglutinin N-terminal domain-containing protein, partial [Candidatus Eremiobacteraeota bacterium]|nr:filamentous hemagglutinin N-terminal domain-containing protein [Candidatus Eremiobacteraeota bacterium]